MNIVLVGLAIYESMSIHNSLRDAHLAHPHPYAHSLVTSSMANSIPQFNEVDHGELDSPFHFVPNSNSFVKYNLEHGDFMGDSLLRNGKGGRGSICWVAIQGKRENG